MMDGIIIEYGDSKIRLIKCRSGFQLRNDTPNEGSGFRSAPILSGEVACRLLWDCAQDAISQILTFGARLFIGPSHKKIKFSGISCRLLLYGYRALQSRPGANSAPPPSGRIFSQGRLAEYILIAGENV